MELDRGQIIDLLNERDPQVVSQLFDEAYRTKVENVGESVYLRGLIEISNICRKNCLYCGIRSDNSAVVRYQLSNDDVLGAAKFALAAGYGSIVIQGGERQDKAFVKDIKRLIKKIKRLSRENPLGITLSLGEQPIEVYEDWFDAGAHRYLLRIETSNEELYNMIHPSGDLHSFNSRVQALLNLKYTGYQVGTGVMIGLPFQTTEHLADDLLFFRDFDIDMCGMGPYLEHSQTPMWSLRGTLLPPQERLTLSLKMVALLRLLMPDINIAATTAMQTLHPEGREMAIMAGANVIMPNMTIQQVRSSYQIYENKPGIEDDAAISRTKLENFLSEKNIPIGFNQWGDSLRFKNR
jgi:biotin synthase